MSIMLKMMLNFCLNEDFDLTLLKFKQIFYMILVMIDVKFIFGNNLKKLRNKLNLSQDQFSEQIAIGATTLSVIESGKSFTSSETINNICRVFNIPVSALFEFDSAYITNNYGNRKEMVNDITLLLDELDDNKLKLAANFILMLKERIEV